MSARRTSVEAAWRRWGSRYGVSPSAYIASQESHLRYVETYRTVRRLAAGVFFVPRPFRRDLLDGNFATDFDRRFLRGAVAPVAPDSPWGNQGLALDVRYCAPGSAEGPSLGLPARQPCSPSREEAQRAPRRGRV